MVIGSQEQIFKKISQKLYHYLWHKLRSRTSAIDIIISRFKERECRPYLLMEERLKSYCRRECGMGDTVVAILGKYYHPGYQDNLTNSLGLRSIRLNRGGTSRWQKSKTWRSLSSPQIHQKYIYIWNNSYRTPTEHWQKTSAVKVWSPHHWATREFPK